MVNKQIIYVGPIGTEGTAMAIHTRNIAEILEQNGHRVSFVCQSVPNGYNEYKKNDKYTYSYANQYIKIPKLRAIEWMIEELSGFKLFKLFKKQCRKIKPDLVIFYGYSAERKVIKYCKKNNIKIIIDRTDWFDKIDRKGVFGRIFTRFLSDKCIEKYDYMANGVISISKYFYEFYTSGGQNTIWIPPIFKVNKKEIFNRSKPNEVNLVYAGSLGGKKDNIYPVVECMIKDLIDMKNQVKLNLVGITEMQLNEKFGEHKWPELGINAYGRVPHSIAEKIVSEADFSFLLRQNKRYAKAGFSTKFAESMANGVPVICTKVGGADLLVNDTENGILVNNNDISTIMDTLSRISKLNDTEITKMKQAAYITATKYFNSSVYINDLREFIENI